MITTSRARATDQRYYGVVEAVVTDVNDKDKEGRVKMKYPWFDENMETEWCRVSQIYAGNGYGAFFIPEVGDEVLVAFVHGDMRRPIIIGGLYNGKDKPPSERTDEKDQKMIRTKGKHELLFDDSNGKERVRITTKGEHVADLNDFEKKILIKSKGDHKVLLDDQNQQISVKSKGGHELLLDDQNRKAQLTTSGQHQVVLDDNQKKLTISTTSKNTITLDDSGNKITIQTSGGQIIEMQAGKITLTATSVAISAQSIQLGGDGATHPLVLGDMLLTSYNAHTHNCTAIGAPTGPPLSPLTPGNLSTTSKTS